jgi:hypothetical protein
VARLRSHTTTRTQQRQVAYSTVLRSTTLMPAQKKLLSLSIAMCGFLGMMGGPFSCAQNLPQCGQRHNPVRILASRVMLPHCEKTQTSEKELFSSTCTVHTPTQTLNFSTPLREKSDPRICAKRDMSAQLKEPCPTEPAMYNF